VPGVGFVDLHSHVVPSGDDGAATVDEGIALCTDASAHGTTVLYATPHVWPHLPLTEAREQDVRAAFDRMKPRVPLELRLGFELTPTRELLDEDPVRYALDGTAAVLVEIPFVGPADLVFALVDHVEEAGLRAVIAHPERTEAVLLNRSVANQLAERGCLLQVNATSLLGYHGETPAAVAWQLIDDRLVSIVASDGHRSARPARLDGAYRAARARMGEEVASLFDGTGLALSAAGFQVEARPVVSDGRAGEARTS
jgi:protein-tyrosine phosphatase